jgi:hypothetical protein
MPQNRPFVAAVLASAVLALVPLQLISEAQEQAPAAPASAGGGRGVGGIFPVLYGNGVRIAQTPNDVIIMSTRATRATAP